MREKRQYTVVISRDECKGCGRCVAACPRQVLAMAEALNIYGLPYAEPVKAMCIGCGACFYACPEPGAVTVLESAGASPDGGKEGDA